MLMHAVYNINNLMTPHATCTVVDPEFEEGGFRVFGQSPHMAAIATPAKWML